MKQKLFIGVYISILVLFVCICVLSVFELTRSNSLSNQINSLKGNQSQTQKMEKTQKELQSQLEIEQQANSKLSSQLNDLQSQVTKIQQTKAIGKGKVAYLTFDDGPSINTPRVLDALKANNVHATFFVIGTNAQSNPDVVKRAYSEGNVIGIHSWSHVYNTIYANESNYFEDFNKLKDYLTTLLGVSPTVSRYPGGTNETQGNPNHVLYTIDPKVKAMGIKPYDWNSYAGDAVAGYRPTVDQTVSNVMSTVSGQKALVILMHDTAVNGNDALALPEIVKELHAQGYTFGTLSNTTPKVQWDPKQ